ncbi:MAG TPA: hypothetical protein VKG45_09245 [Actinomycetes bacterium]|nr:hypothetical protein [Actinomycetes bacterium]
MRGGPPGLEAGPALAPGRVLAHGLVTRSDLPVPFWVAQYGAAVVLLGSFALLGLLWRAPRFERGGGLTLPATLARAAAAPATRVALRALGLGLAAVTVVVAVAGPPSAFGNPAPTWFYVWFWVGLVPASLLLGPVWRALNPLRTLARGLAVLSGDPREEGARPPPVRLGYWPAAAGLAAFAWLELVWADPEDPRTVLVFLGVYALAQLGASMRYGQAWFDRGDAFEAYSTLVGQLAPLGRPPAGDGPRTGRTGPRPERLLVSERRSGTRPAAPTVTTDRPPDPPLVLRNPLRGLAAIPPAPGLVALVCVLLGSTGFDGLSSTAWWSELAAGGGQGTSVLLATAGLAASIGVVAVTYALAIRLAGALAGDRKPDLPGLFAHTLLPIGLGYVAAHYLTLLVFQGQAGYILASDPLGRGWDLFGTAGWQIDTQAVPAATLALVQVAAIVLGHVLGAVAAHDRAVALFPPRAARRSQYALLGVMVAYTITGIGLLLG